MKEQFDFRNLPGTGSVVDFGNYSAGLCVDGGFLRIKVSQHNSGLMNWIEARKLAKYLMTLSHSIEFNDRRRTDGASLLPVGMLVYAISDGRGNYKIGKAGDVATRIRQLQTGNGNRLTLHSFVLCDTEAIAFRVERHAQKRLAKHKAVGEWFSCELQDVLDAFGYATDLCGIDRSALMSKQLKEDEAEVANGR